MQVEHGEWLCTAVWSHPPFSLSASGKADGRKRVLDAPAQRERTGQRLEGFEYAVDLFAMIKQAGSAAGIDRRWL